MAAVYRTVDLTRLPVIDGQGQPLPHDLYPLAVLDVR
jgi:hypothetical protein